ncbi:MAG: hypothetical protein ACETWQ_08550, partial [Phycisphaerae bacterium]
KSGDQEIRGSGNQGIRKSGDQEIRGSGNQGIRRAGDQESRKSGEQRTEGDYNRVRQKTAGFTNRPFD